jgi:hypothetical protein
LHGLDLPTVVSVSALLEMPVLSSPFPEALPLYSITLRSLPEELESVIWRGGYLELMVFSSQLG